MNCSRDLRSKQATLFIYFIYFFINKLMFQIPIFSEKIKWNIFRVESSSK
jgi:hypothetical protein